MENPVVPAQMLKLETGMSIKLRFQNGFTLIEILVVLFIIGIVSSVSFLHFGDFGASRRSHQYAEQFAQFIHLVQQQAILENHMYSIHINKDFYSAFRLINNNNWQEMNNTTMLKKHYFPKDISVKTYSTKKYTQTTSIITISPSGALSPFQIVFQTAHAKHATKLSAKNDSITIQNL